MAKRIPVALSIAGSDSGGGAGIQADLKTFAALGVHGTSVITCVTAQTPDHVRRIVPCSPKIVRQQIEAVLEGLPPAAVKTGMLFSGEIVRVIARCFAGSKPPPLVVDPVMVATSGARLLAVSAVKIVKSQLLPLATLVTPNLDEAAVLVGRRIKSRSEEHTSELQSRPHLVCRLLLEKKKPRVSDSATFSAACRQKLQR